jgi:hypothetical protein
MIDSMTKSTTALINRRIHQQMRVTCLQHSITTPEIIERALTQYLRDLKA